jgi:hypothetical protein
MHQFETQELTDLLMCSEAYKERRSSSTQTPTHTGLMTGPLLPLLQWLPDRPTNPKTLNSTPNNAANPIAEYLQQAVLNESCTGALAASFCCPPSSSLDGLHGVSVELVLGSVDTV